MKNLLALCVVAGLLGLSFGCQKDTGSKPKAGGGPGGPAKTDNKDKIVGKWGFVKAVDKDGKPDKNSPPEGATFEYTKDGALKISFMNPMTKQEMTINGTYKVDGDKIDMAMKPAPNAPEEKDSGTITKLTDTELDIKDSKGVTATLKKK